MNIVMVNCGGGVLQKDLIDIAKCFVSLMNEAVIKLVSCMSLYSAGSHHFTASLVPPKPARIVMILACVDDTGRRGLLVVMI